MFKNILKKCLKYLVSIIGWRKFNRLSCEFDVKVAGVCVTQHLRLEWRRDLKKKEKKSDLINEMAIRMGFVQAMDVGVWGWGSKI